MSLLSSLPLKTFFSSSRNRSLIGVCLFSALLVYLVFFKNDIEIEKTQVNEPFNTVSQTTFAHDFQKDKENYLEGELSQKDNQFSLLHSQQNTISQQYLGMSDDLSKLGDKVNDIFRQLTHLQNDNDDRQHLKNSSKSAQFRLLSVENSSQASVKNYLPAGTFVSAKILGGVDVSTSPSAKQHPQPMLLELTGQARLPSHQIVDIAHCRVTAQTWGDLSAERAYARTDNLSCVLPSGKIVDTKIQAFIVDETGKNGLRGDVVARHEGAMITQAFLSKFISSLGGVGTSLADGFLQNQENINWQAASKGSLIAGAGHGVQGLGETLENYFISRLNELSPVIQVFADKDVCLVLTKGLWLEPTVHPKGD